ncbi:MAG: hypothetical protein ABI682_13390 [Acidobacteriota bacterium]
MDLGARLPIATGSAFAVRGEAMGTPSPALGERVGEGPEAIGALPRLG